MVRSNILQYVSLQHTGDDTSRPKHELETAPPSRHWLSLPDEDTVRSMPLQSRRHPVCRHGSVIQRFLLYSHIPFPFFREELPVPPVALTLGHTSHGNGTPEQRCPVAAAACE